MAALLDHADSDGLLRDSGAWGFPDMYSNLLLCYFRRTHVFRRGDVVDTSNAALEFSERSLWFGGWCASSLEKSLCGGDAASSTPRGGGVAARNTDSEKKEWL